MMAAESKTKWKNGGKKYKSENAYLSNPRSVTGIVFPAQMVELVTGCYLNGVPWIT